MYRLHSAKQKERKIIQRVLPLEIDCVHLDELDPWPSTNTV